MTSIREDEAPEDVSFRAEVRAWLHANAEPRRSDGEFRLFAERHDKAYLDRAKQWQGKKATAGWAGIAWPREYGGRGGTPVQQAIWDQEAARFEAPEDVFAAGVRQGGPTLMFHGTEAQKRRYLPPLLRGDEIWCQLFSEPGAGSDLASVTTRAERDSGGWVLNGQKVWTSGAHYADVGFALARTSWDVPKHRGLTYFLVDMHAAGVTVRPLRQMTGGSNFNEVFLDDVPVSADDVVGEVGHGWAVARTTLLFERAMSGGGGLDGAPMRRLIEFVRDRQLNGAPAAADPVVRQELMRVYTQGETLRMLVQRAMAQVLRGGTPGPEGSVGKLAAARLLTATANLAMRVSGAAATLDGPDAPSHGAWQHLFLAAPAVRIAGGTDEVQRNIIAEQTLGLPREPQLDREVPFREVAGRAPWG